MGHSMCRPNWKIPYQSQRRRKEIPDPNKGDEKKYKMSAKSGKSVYLQATIMIVLIKGWIEINTVPLARSDLLSN